MSKEKVARNRLMAECYNQGKTDREILETLLKEGFASYKSEKSISMQLSRLRQAGKIPMERPKSLKKKEKKPANKQTGKPAIQQVSKLAKKRPAKEIYDTVTYYIDKETRKKIKILAAEQDMEISQIVRQIFKQYFDRY